MRTTSPRPALAVLTAAACFAASAPADAVFAGDGAALTVRFLYDGEPPEPEPVEVNKDEAVCGTHGLVENSLRVDPQTRGVANVVVWLDPRTSGRTPEVDPPPEEPVVLDNEGCRFVPHVTLLRAGRPLKITNGDPVAHQATVFLNRNLPFNDSVAAGGDPVVRTLEKAELLPVPVTCPIHPWMRGYLFVQDHPFMAVSGADGSLTIDDLPAGDWKFRVWHERAGFLKAEDVAGDPPAGWESATLSLTVPADGALKLGDVRLKPAAFE